MLTGIYDCTAAKGGGGGKVGGSDGLEGSRMLGMDTKAPTDTEKPHT